MFISYSTDQSQNNKQMILTWIFNQHHLLNLSPLFLMANYLVCPIKSMNKPITILSEQYKNASLWSFPLHSTDELLPAIKTSEIEFNSSSEHFPTTKDPLNWQMKTTRRWHIKCRQSVTKVSKSLRVRANQTITWCSWLLVVSIFVLNR